MDLVRRGDVWLVKLDPVFGSEISKTRPCVIVSPDEINRVLRTVIVVPMTTGSRAAPFRIAVDFEGRKGLAVPDHVRGIDRGRCIKKLGHLDVRTFEKILGALTRMFDTTG